MDKKALQFCARFALQPNLLGFCGRNSAPAKLFDCIVNGNCDGVREELEKFIVLNPYLQTIAEITGKDPFSYEVIEAYWLGNDLLKQIKLEHYQILITNLAKQGVPDFLIAEIKNKIPKEFIPIHLFNILHVGVGKASGSVPFNLGSINNCMVRWGKVSSKGKVVSIKGDKNDQYSYINFKIEKKLPLDKEGRQAKHGREILSSKLATVQTVKLTQKEKHYHLIESTEEIPYLAQLTGELKIGDHVALHWGWIAKKINQNEILILKEWTEKLLEN